MYKYNVFDLEILRTVDEVGGWDNKTDMGVSCAVIQGYDEIDQKPEIFVYSDPVLSRTSPLSELLKYISDIYNSDNYLIGHNIIDFDFQVLPGVMSQIDDFTYKNDIVSLAMGFYCNMKVVDTIKGFPFQWRPSLSKISYSTIGKSKTDADPANIPIMWRNLKFDSVINYCINDVSLVRDIYNFYRKNGYVLIEGKKYEPQWER